MTITGRHHGPARQLAINDATFVLIHGVTKAYFTEMGPHGYAALNVLTGYATSPKGVIAPEGSIHALQQKAGNWMDDFVFAIKHPEFSFDTYLADYRQTAEVIEAL